MRVSRPNQITNSVVLQGLQQPEVYSLRLNKMHLQLQYPLPDVEKVDHVIQFGNLETIAFHSAGMLSGMKPINGHGPFQSTELREVPVLA